MFAKIFTSSTPDTRPDWCDSMGVWRVAHRDHLKAVLASCPGVDADVYADHDSDSSKGACRLWISYRDNRDGEKHAARLSALAVTLRGHGLSVRTVKRGGRVRGLRVTDAG